CSTTPGGQAATSSAEYTASRASARLRSRRRKSVTLDLPALEVFFRQQTTIFRQTLQVRGIGEADVKGAGFGPLVPLGHEAELELGVRHVQGGVRQTFGAQPIIDHGEDVLSPDLRVSFQEDPASADRQTHLADANFLDAVRRVRGEEAVSGQQSIQFV